MYVLFWAHRTSLNPLGESKPTGLIGIAKIDKADMPEGGTS
jgi:hypothetical protein